MEFRQKRKEVQDLRLGAIQYREVGKKRTNQQRPQKERPKRLMENQRPHLNVVPSITTFLAL